MPNGFQRKLFRYCYRRKRLRPLTRRFWQGVEVDVEGVKFALYPADNTTERNLYLEQRLGEPQSLHALAERLSGKRALFADIGANCGLFSLFLLPRLGSGSRMDLYEPNPRLVERLQQNLQLNTEHEAVEVHVHQTALGAEPGRAVLNLHPRNFGQSSLAELNEDTTPLEVEIQPLAATLPQRSAYECLAIKIDVEGHEDKILCPWLASLEDEALPDHMLIEHDNAGRWQQDLKGLLLERGYIISLEAEGNELFDLNRGV